MYFHHEHQRASTQRRREEIGKYRKGRSVELVVPLLSMEEGTALLCPGGTRARL